MTIAEADKKLAELTKKFKDERRKIDKLYQNLERTYKGWDILSSRAILIEQDLNKVKDRLALEKMRANDDNNVRRKPTNSKKTKRSKR